MEALAKILPKMKKFDAYINDVKKDNFPISLAGLSDSQKVHFAYATRFYTERPILIVTYNDILRIGGRFIRMLIVSNLEFFII